MSRTIVEVPINQDQIDSVISTIKKILSMEGYQEKILDGENVWCKGDGIMVQMQCFSIVFTEKTVLIQAWMRDAILGESTLDGFTAIVPKKKMKSILERIRNQVICNSK